MSKATSDEVEAAEVEKLRAEAAAAWALRDYNLAEARKVNIEADREQLDLENARRKQARELAGDEYHHVYTYNEAVSKASTDKCIGQLSTWMRNTTESLRIEVVFNSPGGSVIDGMALFDYIQFVRAQGHHVTTSCIGMAASMAGVLLQAGTTRVMGREAYILIHEIAFGAAGKIGEIEDEIAFGRKIQERIVAILAERSTLTPTKIKRRWKRTDWWLSSDEALALGLVDEVR